MSSWMAVAWKELRQLRSNLLVLAIFVAGAPALVALDPLGWGAAEVVHVVALTALGVAAALLGATLLAGDPAPAFEASMPLPWTGLVASRLALRLACFAGLALLAAAAVAALAPLVPSPHRSDGDGAFAATLPWLVALLLSSALASCFRRRPLEAALDSLWVFPLATIASLPLLAAVGVHGAGALLAVALGSATLLAASRRRLDVAGLRRRTLRAALTALAAVAALLGLYLAIGHVVAHVRVKQARAAWEAELGSLDVAARFPTRPANAPAVELETLLKPLGLSLAPKTGAESFPRSGPDHDGRAALRDYLNAALDGPARVPLAPAGATWIERHDADLAAIRSRVLEGEIPRQALTVEGGALAPIPNLLGHVNLQRVLLADALFAAERGEVARARAAFDAAVRLNEGLRAQPALICQLIVVASARMQVATLRHLPFATREDLARIDAPAASESLLEGLRSEAWWLSRLGEAGSGVLAAFSTSDTGASRVLTRAWWFLVSPLARAGGARALDGLREDVARARAATPCEVAAWERPPRAESRLSLLLNPIAYFTSPSHVGALQRAALLELEAELTGLVIDARAARASDPGRAWPSIFDSAACPGTRWRHELGADGSLTLAYDGEISTARGEIEARLRHVENPS